MYIVICVYIDTVLKGILTRGISANTHTMASINTQPVESPLSGTPAVFIKTDDLINSTVKDYTICKAVADTIGADHLIGCQRIGRVWRVYPKDTESRVKLLTNCIQLQGQQVPIYAENPFRTGAKEPNDIKVKITIKDMPLSKGNTAIQKFLEGKNIKVTSRIDYAKARDPETHQLSEWLNGDRICFAEKMTTPLPRTAFVGDTRVRIFHDGQESPVDKLCTRCFSTEHYRSRCTNTPCCNHCRKPGHNPGDPSCEASLHEAQQDIVTIQGKEDVLSNFYPCDIKIFGMNMKSAEHAYQYSKAIRRGDLDQAKKIADARNASDAKYQARFLKHSQTWKSEREEVMRDVLAAKAQHVPEFKETLVQSKDKTLVETVRNETYWASGLDSQDTLHTKPQFWMGKNRLGALLSELRESLLSEETKIPKKSRTQGQKDSRISTRLQSKNTSVQRQNAADFMDDERTPENEEGSNNG